MMPKPIIYLFFLDLVSLECNQQFPTSIFAYLSPLGTTWLLWHGEPTCHHEDGHLGNLACHGGRAGLHCALGMQMGLGTCILGCL